jgi:hypothetical protein
VFDGCVFFERGIDDCAPTCLLMLVVEMTMHRFIGANGIGGAGEGLFVVERLGGGDSGAGSGTGDGGEAWW